MGFLFFSKSSVLVFCFFATMGFQKNLGGLAKMSWTIWRLWVLMESDLPGSWVDGDEGWRWETESITKPKGDHFLGPFLIYGAKGLGFNANGFMVLRPLWFYYFDNLHSFLMLVESDLKIMSPDLQNLICAVDWRSWSQIQSSGDDFTKLFHGIVSAGWLKVSSGARRMVEHHIVSTCCMLYTMFLLIFSIHNYYAIVCKYMICCGMDL